MPRVGESFTASSRMFRTGWRSEHSVKVLISLAHPAGFEPAASAFGGRALVVNFALHYSALPSVLWCCVSMVRQMWS